MGKSDAISLDGYQRKASNEAGGAGVWLTVVLEGVRRVVETIGCCRAPESLVSNGDG